MIKWKSSILTFFVAVALIGTMAINIQQVSAPRECPECGAFKKLSHDFIKEVIETVKALEPNEDPIPHLSPLLEQYESEVLRLFVAPPDPE